MLQVEVFSARHGDALFLHYGTEQQPKLAMIDGGPGSVFKTVMAPRLAQLGRRGKIPRMAWVNVSHVDEDHVTGVLALFREMHEASTPPASVDALFHNVPTPSTGSGVKPLARDGAAKRDGRTGERDRLELDLAGLMQRTLSTKVKVVSFAQGAELANLARLLHVSRNPTDGQRLLTGDLLPDKVVGPLKVTVVAPSIQHLRDLIDAWRAELGADGGVITAAASQSIDTSVTNLSSVVLLVEHGTHRVLLTGDARADHVVQGLGQLGLLPKGRKRFEVDLLKLPHHGSDRTTSVVDDVPSLLERVRAKHYVVSANGHYDNPSEEVLRRLVRAQGRHPCTVWLTAPEGQKQKYGPTFDRAVAALRSEIAAHKARIDVKLPTGTQTSQVIPIET